VRTFLESASRTGCTLKAFCAGIAFGNFARKSLADAASRAFA
jgi:hypothetical protein